MLSMTKKTGIKKIVFDINGKEVSLSLEDAKKLCNTLNDLFSRETTTYPFYPQPYWRYPEITCTDSTTGTSIPMPIAGSATVGEING